MTNVRAEEFMGCYGQPIITDNNTVVFPNPCGMMRPRITFNKRTLEDIGPDLERKKQEIEEALKRRAELLEELRKGGQGRQKAPGMDAG